MGVAVAGAFSITRAYETAIVVVSTTSFVVSNAAVRRGCQATIAVACHGSVGCCHLDRRSCVRGIEDVWEWCTARAKCDGCG